MTMMTTPSWTNERKLKFNAYVNYEAVGVHYVMNESNEFSVVKSSMP